MLRLPSHRSIVLALALIGCGSSGERSDAGRPPDAARVDGGPRSDGGHASDGGDGDGGEMGDASVVVDGGVPVTRFRIIYPDGAAIALRGAGAPFDWETGVDMTPMGGGVYVFSTDAIDAPIEWKPLLDDTTWARGPNFHVEPGATVEIAPHFTPTSGRVTELLAPWTSTALGNARAVWAYLPASYEENTAARYAVVYMHDGQNLFDPALAFGGNEWEVDETMDGAAEAGRCAAAATTECTNDGECGGGRCDTFREAIVIGVANGPDRIGEYTPTVDPGYGGGRADVYLDALVDELAPQVRAMLRTSVGAEDTALLGSSLGGLCSVHGGITHPETFGLIGAMSPSTWWDGRTILTEVATIPTHPGRALRVYVDSGDAGASSDGVTDTEDLAAAYVAAGYVEGTDFHYLVAPGHEHNETYWRQRLPTALTFLLGPRER